MHECDYNWKTFIEVYLEDYHVEPFHPGLGSFVDLRRPALGVRRRLLGADRRREERARQPGTPVYRKWHDALLQAAPTASTPKYGAIWLTYYPNIMVEWYPHVLIVSHALPTARRRP